MPVKSKKFIIIAIIAAVVVFNIYKRLPHGGGAMPQMGGAAPVSIAEVVQKDVQEWNEFSGRLVAVDKVEVRPRVSGIIESVNFENGAIVQKDDLLFTIDSRAYAAEVSRAEGALASASAQASLAGSELARAERLFKEKAIPQREYDERKNGYNVAHANLKSAQASLESAKLNLEYTQVKSPITGKVSRAEITVGNLVEAGPNAPVLTTVVSSNPIYADFEVDEDTYLKYSNINPADGNATKIPVMMSLGSSDAISQTGHIDSFDNRMNTASGTIRARAVFENADGKLVPGLFARIKLGSSDKSSAVLITDRAIGTDQDKKFVFVVGEGNKVAYRVVKLGGVADNLRIVQDGLKPGEKIVVNGLQRVRPEAVIKPEIVDMASGQPAAQAMEPAAGQASEDEKKMPELPAPPKE